MEGGRSNVVTKGEEQKKRKGTNIGADITAKQEKDKKKANAYQPLSPIHPSAHSIGSDVLQQNRYRATATAAFFPSPSKIAACSDHLHSPLSTPSLPCRLRDAQTLYCADSSYFLQSRKQAAAALYSAG